MSSNENASSNSRDGLPSYNQVFHMDDIATAPLMNETFSGSIFGTATTLKFEWDSGMTRDNYSFIIRDPSECLQARGKVCNLNTTLTNINGIDMLKITIKSTIPNSNENNIHTFNVHHNNANIGTIIFVENAPAGSCLKILHKNVNPEIVVRSLKLGDFAIFRDNSSLIPLCNIHMPNASSYTAREFNVTIVFQPETGITAQEQLLCTAAAIAFKVTMKQLTTRANDSNKWCGYVGGILCILIFIGVFGIFWKLMEIWGCEHKKKQGYAGYANRQC